MSETCERCGLRYEDLDTGLTYREIVGMLWSADPDPATWRYKRRGTVLGMWHQMKLELWTQHLATCDGWSPDNLKAYRINWGEIEAYVAAPRRARAKYLAAKSIADTWDLTIGQAFKELRCRRARWGDSHASFCGEGIMPTYSKIYETPRKDSDICDVYEIAEIEETGRSNS